MILRKLLAPLVATVLLLGLPLLGVEFAGHLTSDYWEFPPRTQYVEHAPFSWIAFVVMALVIVAFCLPFEFRVLRWRKSVSPAPDPARTFPWWGWLGLSTGVIFWILAWTRFDWFAPFQRYTFSPIWFSYIVVVNALTYRQTGRSTLTHRPGYLAKLFLASAFFWWFFEYLNRFVQNWRYEGIGELSGSEYFWFATLPFSTVLPAVMGTYEYLRTQPRAGAGLDHFIRLDVPRPKLTAWVMLGIASFGLAGIGIWPDYLFPLLWLSPLFVVTSLLAITGNGTALRDVKTGNWRRIYLFAMSALICGFFWEMWNYGSMAKWIYQVPFVHKFPCFEMPILGYAGYLPFGLECAVIGQMLEKEK